MRRKTIATNDIYMLLMRAAMGEKLDQIEPFYPDRMASRILGMGDLMTMIEKAEQVNEKELSLRVYVDTVNGDVVKVSIPYPIAKEIAIVGKNISSVVSGIDLSGVDFETIFAMVEKGILGEFVNIKSQNGDVVRVVVEK